MAGTACGVRPEPAEIVSSAGHMKVGTVVAEHLPAGEALWELPFPFPNGSSQ